MKSLYTAEVTVKDGRTGNAKSQDGYLNHDLSKPESMGGDGSEGTNPEQMFAAAYGACFLEALKGVAKKENVELHNPRMVVKVSFNEEEEESKSYQLSAALNVIDESVDTEQLDQIVRKTHQVCPYSKATRGNMDVVLTANKIEVEA